MVKRLVPVFAHRTRLGVILCMSVTLAVGLPPAAARSPQPSGGGFAWEPIDTGLSLHLGALDVVDTDVAWLVESGAGGDVVRTTDGGLSFDVVSWQPTSSYRHRGINAVMFDRLGEAFRR